MDQTALGNTQVAGASTAGGPALVVASNSSKASLHETGSASAQSGVSVALNTRTPAAAGGSVRASSGAAQANGVTAQNTLANNSVALAQVGGTNSAPVTVQASNAVLVQDTGAARGVSGSALAQPPGAETSVRLPGSEAPATGQGQPAPGLESQVSITGATDSTTIASGAQGSGAVNVTHSQRVEVTSAGAGGAASSGTADAPSGPGMLAASGAVQAQGVVAQNTVSHDATATVQVRGQNLAPIQIIIDSITRILNAGSATAISGNATAGGPSGTAATSSADANATGANVVNRTSLSASAFVHITGDNYNPINLFLSLFVGLTNRGLASASSGAATRSGNASAVGLQALNQVELQARAGVLVDGSNYAPIDVHLWLETDIFNTGEAVATSGNTARGSGSHPAAGPKAAVATSTPWPLAQTRTQTLAQVSSPMGPRDSSSITLSSEVAAGNGTSGATGSSSSLAAAAALAPPPGSGTWATSGDASCLGSVSDSRVGNTQVSFVANPGGPSLARNALGHAVDSRGDVTCGAGFAGVNATPTPVPTPTPTGGASQPGHSMFVSSGAGVPTTTTYASVARFTSLQVARVAPRVAEGQLVKVAWQHAYPPFEPPRMPVQRTRARDATVQDGPTFTAARAEPRASELPLPDQTLRGAVVGPIQPQQSAARASVRLSVGAPPAALNALNALGATEAAPQTEATTPPMAGGVDPPSLPERQVEARPTDTPVPVPVTSAGEASADSDPGDPIATMLALLTGLVALSVAGRRGRWRTWLATLRLGVSINKLSGRTVR